MEISVHQDKLSLGRAASSSGAAAIRAAIEQRGSANIIVATGASQFETLGALVEEPNIAWNKVTAFHLDEYVGLPLTHPASFRLYLWQRFVSRLALPLHAFHYVNAENNPEVECRRLGQLAQTHPIDVAFIGIGENGHIAFNDPPADFETQEPYIVVELDEACRRQQFGEGWFPTLGDVPKQAISMSVRQILKSQLIVCSVPDQRKAEAVRNTVNSSITPQVPASILQQHPATTLYLDSASASLLN